MGRPRRNGVRLDTRIPPHVMTALRRDVAERGGSLGDAITRLFEQGTTQGDAALRAELAAARLEAKALLDTARRLHVSNKAKDERWARASAATKARARQ